MSDLERLVTVQDFEEAARARLSPAAWDYYRSGADEEVTLRRNDADYTRYEIRHRAFVDVSLPRTETTVLGARVTSPILVAPTAYHKLACEEGELATARAAARAGSLYVASTLATTSLEDVALAAPPEEALRYCTAAGPRGTLLWYPDGTHGLYDELQDWMTDVAGWLHERAGMEPSSTQVDTGMQRVRTAPPS